MAQFFHVVERLGMPFHATMERVLVVPTEGCSIQAKARKIELVLAGRCYHRFEGEARHLFAAGDVLVVPTAKRQFYEPVEPNEPAHLHALIISFDSRYLPFEGSPPAGTTTPIEGAEAPDVVEFIKTCFPRNAHLNQVLDAALMENLMQIRHEAAMHLSGFRWRITALCASCVVQLARKLEHHQFSPLVPPEANRGLFLVSCTKEYLLQHLNHEIHLQDVAEHLYVSSGHLARTFKRVAGQSLFSYLRQLRLEQAKLQLLNSEKTVTVIAAECGFSSVALFCRNFKQYTSISPLAYRDEVGATERFADGSPKNSRAESKTSRQR